MGLRLTLLAAVVLAVLVAWTLYLGTGAVQGISWSLGFASIALAVTSWYAWRVRDHASKKYFDLDAESDRLANAVRSQYERERTLPRHLWPLPNSNDLASGYP